MAITGSAPDSGWSVRARIALATLIVSVLALAASGAVAYLAQRDRALSQVDARLVAVVDQVATVAAGPNGSAVTDHTDDTDPPGDAGDDMPDGITADASAYADLPALLRAVVTRLVVNRYDSTVALLDGKVRYVPAVQDGVPMHENQGLLDRVIREVAEHQTTVIGTAAVPEGHLRYLAVPVRVTGDDREGIYLTGVLLDHELEPVDASFRTYAVVAAGSALAVALVAWLLAGRLLRPLRQLRETASRISLTDLQERIPVRGSDDISALSRTMNDTLDRLERSVTAQRHLLDDIRHELATPLTVIRGHLELLDSSDASEVESTRGLALEEIDRMTELIADIQFLASSEQEVNLGPTDVAELTEQVARKVRALPGHTWTLVERATGVTQLDASRITQAWLQLAENAAKYSPANTEVRLGARREPGVLVLWVEDDGPGIAPELQERIFERFGRADPGRGIAGSGLGLSIAKAIVEAHEGTIAVRSDPGEGARFTITLPWRDPEEAP